MPLARFAGSLSATAEPLGMPVVDVVTDAEGGFGVPVASKTAP